MNRWAVAGITFLVFAAMPFYVAILASGWAWRRVALNANKIKLCYRIASPIR